MIHSLLDKFNWINYFIHQNQRSFIQLN